MEQYKKIKLNEISVIDLICLKEDIKNKKLHIVEQKTKCSHKIWIANNIGEQILIYDAKLYEVTKIDVEVG